MKLVVMNRPAPGDFVASKFSDGYWYRGLVKSVSADFAKVVYIDYGNEETADVHSLHILEDVYKSLPSLVRQT